MKIIKTKKKNLTELNLRDLFAMHAIIGFHRGSLWTSDNWQGLAEKCYKLADAMIEARKNK